MSGRLCVLIPAKNESLIIARTIKSLLSARVLPSDIYVVDDGSSDGTGGVAVYYEVQVLRNKRNIGKANSIKRAINHFQLLRRYNFIALMDADTQVSGNYFREVKRGFGKDEGIAVVCGQVKSAPHNWLTAYRAFSYAITHIIYRSGQENMGVITVAPGCATTYRASAFAQIEWSNDTLVEDMDATIQVHHKKLGRIVYRNKALVYTQDPRTIRDYVNQLTRWHTGTFQIGIKYKMLTGLTRIDWEYKLLMGEGLIFALGFMSMPLWLLLFPKTALTMLGLDFALATTLSLFIALVNRRIDILKGLLFYPLMRYLDCKTFLYCFWKTVILKQEARRWFSVQRYAKPKQRKEIA